MCLVAAELFGVSKFGLGQKLWFFYNLHQMDSVVVYMILRGLTGLAAGHGVPSLCSRRISSGGGRERWPDMGNLKIQDLSKSFTREDGSNMAARDHLSS